MAIEGTRHSAGQDASGAAISPRRAHWAGVALLTAVTAAAYSVFALFRFFTFQTASYDLVIFDEAVRSYAHFRPGISIIKGVHNGFGPHFSVLGDHWSPILAALAPLYWIHDHPDTLLVAQAVLFALAIPPLWVFTRRAFGGGGKATAAAYLVSGAYALSWPIASAMAFDFHEVAFAPVLMAVALERLQAGRLRTALLALAALLLVKEDMGVFVAGIGVYLAVARPRVVPRQLLVAGILVVVGLADTWFATYALIPAFGGRSDYYWAYQALGSNASQAVTHLITHPASSARLLITPRVKLDTMLWLLAAFCFLSLRSPIALAAIPLLAERMLGTKFPNWWVTPFQYNAYLVIVFAFAAVDGAARLDRWAVLVREHFATRRAGPSPAAAAPSAAGAQIAGMAAGDSAAEDAATTTAAPATTPSEAGPSGTVPSGAGTSGAVPTAAGSAGSPAGTAVPAPPRRPPAARGAGTVALVCAAAMFVVAVYLVPRFGFGPALHASFYHRNARMNAAAAADAAVPSGVTVEAVDNLGPQLSARDTVLLWDGDGQSPRYPPWVVADVRRHVFTFPSVRAQKQRVALLKRSGYQVVFRRDGYVVLRRVGKRAGAASARRVTG
ncbi:MAG TPA: DUF2079 domain-containing protein [Streptosporangiaceae bacterium]|nr:DUF2079 domain-containing protein [Streptosporangiaceae bacterium]